MKIPEHAKQVFKWVIFDVYQRQQEMFDWSFSTFERVKRYDTVQIVPVIDWKIVVCKQHQPDRENHYYSLIWWRNDLNETPEVCAKRELLEETWMESEKLILWKTYNPYNKMERNVYFYIAKNCKKICDQKLDNWEKIELIYLSFEEFIKTCSVRWFSVSELCDWYF